MSIERELQKNYQEVFYPPMPEPEVQPAAAEAPMQLAEVGATKMADYGYSGERQATMTDFDPTMRQQISDFLQAGFERFGMDRYKARQNAQTLMGGQSSNLPLQTGIADIIPFLGTALQTQEAARMGQSSVESAKQGNYGTAALEAGLGVVGMVPGAAGTIKAAKAAATFSTGVLKGFKSVKPKEIPALFSHGTTEKAASSIMESGKFDPATSNRQYSYSEFGLKASYLTPKEGWWLNSEKAQGGRAIVYDSAVDVKVDPKAKIVRIDSPEELNQLAKKSGFVDAYDMMKSLSVDSIEYAVDAQKATTSSLEEFSSFMKKRYPEFSGNPSDIADHYQEMKKLGQYFNEADNATKQLLDSGVDGIYISDKFSANLTPEDYQNWYPAGDQLAMFRQEMLKPVGKRSLKDSPSSTIPTSQQEPK